MKKTKKAPKMKKFGKVTIGLLNGLEKKLQKAKKRTDAIYNQFQTIIDSVLDAKLALKAETKLNKMTVVENAETGKKFKLSKNQIKKLSAKA